MTTPAGTLALAQDPLSFSLDPEPPLPEVAQDAAAGSTRHPRRRASGAQWWSRQADKTLQLVLGPDVRTSVSGKVGQVARIGESGDLLKCSFCGKSQKQVRKLIAGPGVYVCDECVCLCCEILEDEGVPTPRWYHDTVNSEIVLHTWETSLGSWVEKINRQNAERTDLAKAFLQELLIRLDQPKSSPT